MALHEEEERRALEGELWRLERAWEAAEEIAAISDDLLISPDVERFLTEHGPRPPRNRVTPGPEDVPSVLRGQRITGHAGVRVPRIADLYGARLSPSSSTRASSTICRTLVSASAQSSRKRP